MELPYLLSRTYDCELGRVTYGLMITLSPSAFAISEIVIWLNGALTDRSWLEVQIALPLIALGTLLFFFSSKGLDALTLGTVTARSLGIRMDFVLLLLICGSGLVIGASVAVAGIIGFVGLIVPHLVRHSQTICLPV